MANILAIGNTVATSANVSVTPGAPLNIQLIGPDANSATAKLQVFYVGSDSTAYDRGLYDPQKPILDGNGTYNFKRLSGNFGVDAY